MAEVAELQKLKLAELRQECEARGLDIKGNKGELIARLQAYLEEHDEDLDVNEDDVLGEDTEVNLVEAEENFAKVEGATEVKVSKDPETEECENETPEDKKLVKITPPSSSSERLQKRAERFSVPASAESKKAIRAARFGLPTDSATPSPGLLANSKPAVSMDQLKKRAERFGMNVSSISQKVEEDEKLKKRKERFGVSAAAAPAAAAAGETPEPAPAPAVKADVEAKKMKRAERFGKV